MENNWEYDYSTLYQGQEQPAAPAAQSSAEAGDMPPVQPTPTRKKSGGGKKVVLSLLGLVLVAAIAFGGAFAGYYVAGQTLAAPSTASSSAATVVPQQTDPVASTSTVSATQGEAMSLVDVSSKAAPSVVVITTEQMTTNSYWGQYVESGAGSGVIISQDGYIVTNNHVVSGASNIKVTLNSGTDYTATLVGTDSQTDVAVIKIDATGLVPATIGNSDALAVGENVIAVGNPLGVLGGTVTNGIISALDREVTVQNTTMTLLQTNAAVSPGNSGGGLFNMAGELVGIVNAKSSSTSSEGLGFAIPINRVMTIADDLMTNGYVTGRPALGVTVITLSNQTAAQYGLTSPGVYIQSVTEGGAAAQAGLQSGDRIVSVNDTLVEQTSDLTSILNSLNVGDSVTLQISRDRQLITVTVVLGEQAAQQ